MLRTKLFKAFAAVVILFAALSAYLGFRLISDRIVAEAQTRVRLDLSSAWALFDSKLSEVETVTRLAAVKEAVVDMCQDGRWTDPDVRSRLERIRVTFGLDFLDVVAPNGQVVLRTTNPYTTGDFKIEDAAITSALKGDLMSCVTVLSRQDLQKEGEGLAERAFIEFEETKYARKTPKALDDRGMAMVSAVPVRVGPNVAAVIYAGVLMNRNLGLVDRICDVVFHGEQYNGAPVGTATIFLDDMRIATTVRKPNGNRALGTRVSKEVADRVLDNGQPWVGEAYVVHDKYLSAYEPILDGNTRIVGMLYVGVLKRPYDDIARGIMFRYFIVSLVVLVAALVFAYIIASRLSHPIHSLVGASNRLSNGDKAAPVPVTGTCTETDQLTRAFNEMTRTLAEREERLKVLNRSYMETLGFVSHELKGPVATIMNYVYLLREQKIGPMNDKQLKAIRTVDGCGNRLVEMVRHYLNLSRIENGELAPNLTRVTVTEDVLAPLFDAAETEIQARKMKIVNTVTPELAVLADINMTREIFENIVNNAIKYGREGGAITVSARVEGAMAVFAVKNEGDGIPADRIGDLFQRYARLEGHQRQKGSGLGLFITKHIVEAHGGTIRADSLPGEWAEFTFSLPVFKA